MALVSCQGWLVLSRPLAETAMLDPRGGSRGRSIALIVCGAPIYWIAAKDSAESVVASGKRPSGSGFL